MIFGITGGSGSGKSTFSAMLHDLGADIIDTDKIAHEVAEKGGACLAELTRAFGNDILDEDGNLLRGRLAEIAFSSNEQTLLLSKITHKYIKAEAERQIAASKSALIGIDGAVIIGSSIEPLCEKIIFVTADREVRIERIKDRDGLTEAQAQKRLDAQPSDEFYRKNSDYVVYNNFSEKDLKSQAENIYNILKGIN